MKEELNALAARLPLNVRFHLIGVVEDIRPYLALYDILVLPSRLDGRPVGVLESLASGVPVLASRVGGVPELVNDGVNGYMCSPAVASEFAGHICSLANDRAKLARLKVGARIFSEKHLDEKLHFAVYETALRDAISYQQSRAGIAQTETRGCVGEAA